MSVKKPIKGFENFYKITSNGRVESLRRNLFLKPNVDRDGYHIYHLRVLGKRFVKKSHRLVAEHFIFGKSKKKNQVNHKNGIKTDNRIKNLEWCSHKDNAKHASKFGLSAYGNRLPQAKLDPSSVKKIRKIYSYGMYTYFDLAKKFDVSYQLIGLVIKNKIWRTR